MSTKYLPTSKSATGKSTKRATTPPRSNPSSVNDRICKSVMRVVVFLADGATRVFDREEGLYVVISTFDEREDASTVDRYAQQLKAKRKKINLAPPGTMALPGFE